MTTSIYDSLAPNSTKLAKFCKHLAIITNERAAAGGGGSENNNNIKNNLEIILGHTAGQKIKKSPG